MHINHDDILDEIFKALFIAVVIMMASAGCILLYNVIGDIL